MQEKTLKILATTIAIIGVFILFFVSENIEASGMLIKDINLGKEGEAVKICGRITNKLISNNHIFLDIYDSSGSIKVVVFNSTSLNLNRSGTDLFSLENEQEICVTGLVDEFPAGSGKVNIIYKKSDA